MSGQSRWQRLLVGLLGQLGSSPASPEAQAVTGSSGIARSAASKMAAPAVVAAAVPPIVGQAIFGPLRSGLKTQSLSDQAAMTEIASLAQFNLERS